MDAINNKKMKIFQTTKKNLRNIDFDANTKPFDKVQLFHFAQAFGANISPFLYLFCVASTVQEYMESVFLTTVCTLIFIAHRCMTFKTSIIFEFMDYFQAIVDESELI